MLPYNSTPFDARTVNSNALLLLGKNGGQDFHPVFFRVESQMESVPPLCRGETAIILENYRLPNLKSPRMTFHSRN